jgi:hypothetical protein
MSADVVSAMGGGAGKIGRYFTIVSALPATVLACYLYLLVRATDWFQPVDWQRVADFRPQDLVILGVTALVLALALNPLQFPLIQLFEGYWGTSTLAVRLATIRTAHHQQRQLTLRMRADEARKLRGPETVRPVVEERENRRRGAAYPARQRVLPTRLGNALRHYEDAITGPYGLDPLVSVPRLAMVAGGPELAYVENQRVQLELAVRTTFLALVAALLTPALMWQSGPWLLLAAAPYAVAYLSYRGAVALAAEYGTSLAVLTELSRFRLYDRLHLKLPENTAEERRENSRLMELFKLGNTVSLSYDHRSEDAQAPVESVPDDQ